MHAINLDGVIKSEYPVVIRMAAKKLQEMSYMNVGSFLSTLNKSDLNELVDMCNAITVKKDHGAALDCICLLGEMVSQAEGIPLDKLDAHRTANLMILLNFEDLARKGVIHFYRERATLGGDLNQLNIARMKD